MKALPIGANNFKEVIEDNCYYVDKTAVIEEILDNKSKVILFPRPRRFGKTLFMSMLENFFNIDKKEENKNLFDNLYISKSPYYNELSNYPVISLNFKDIKKDNFNDFYDKFTSLIVKLYNDKDYVKNILKDNEIVYYDNILNKKATIGDYENSIRNLTEWLERYYKKQVIILIDEYDAVINESFTSGYYKELINLLQPILSSALKDNNSLKLGVLTGVLRIGGTSLFSSLNNLKVYDVMSENYNEYFGFTENETKELLNYYGLELTDEVKNYYDGYNFSGLHIYNPWSLINYADEKQLEPYWMSTGSNKLLKNLLNNIENKETIEKLLKGESIIFDYDKSVTYESFTDSNNLNNLLNLLLVSGYVTLDKTIEEYEGKVNYYKIPNFEVKSDLLKIVQQTILNEENNISSILFDFRRAVIHGEKDKVEKIMNEALSNISYYDETESFYHGFSFGFYSTFLNNTMFEINSNIESGDGRPDILIESKDRNLGLLFEFKIAEREEEMESKSKEAIKQIEDKEYVNKLINHNIKEIKKYTIIFYKKKCIVR